MSKQCTHGKYRCKPCRKGYCVHQKQTNRCRECGGTTFCIHDKRRSRCKDCEGGEICKHKKLRSNCIECEGSQICVHKKQRSICKDCNGSQICEHNIPKFYCKLCKGNGICKHGKTRPNCLDCGGSQLCEHQVNKQKCCKCRGNAYCIHDKIKSGCIDCNGSSFCNHNIRKSRCKECGGSELCNTPLCDSVKHPRYEGYCFGCFIHMYPDKPTVKNYKTKEKSVRNYILETFPEFDWIIDKTIKGLQRGCTSRRPDILLDLGYLVLCVEIDEQQHKAYDTSCEDVRLLQISEDIDERPLVVIRFNPDSYINKKGEKINDTWKLGKDGLLHFISEESWDDRLDTLGSHINYWIENSQDKYLKILEIVKLYYDEFI
jgi:hypothetical protein